METRVVHTADATDLRALYATHEWFADHREGDLDGALDGTDEFVGLRTAEGDLVASARVITDYVYTAKVLDVVVDESVRGRGLGRRLMRAVTTHPRLRDVDELTCNCRAGVAPFYEACGFRVHEMIASDGEDYYVMVYD